MDLYVTGPHSNLDAREFCCEESDREIAEVGLIPEEILLGFHSSFRETGFTLLVVTRSGGLRQKTLSKRLTRPTTHRPSPRDANNFKDLIEK